MRRTKQEALQTRDTVLKAAAHIIAQQGIGAFTIEAVAQEAGLTKGGVLHHFPSKEALVNDLIDGVMQTFNQRLQAELAAEPEGKPGRWLRAYIRTVFFADYDDTNLIPALAAAVDADHQTLERIRSSFAFSQQTAIQDGVDPVQATLIRLAVDGVVFTRALRINVLDSATSQQVYDALLRLTYTAD
jgi:AcrR family transcriptional regulator